MSHWFRIKCGLTILNRFFPFDHALPTPNDGRGLEWVFFANFTRVLIKQSGYLTKVAGTYRRNNLVRIILQGLTIPSKTGPMKKTQNIRRTSIQHVLSAWFNKTQEAEAINAIQTLKAASTTYPLQQ